ncbi:MAG: ABC transporter ATP-binding protein [Candidatus Altiarchaeales archaeon]|nr:ABC transporter ATP-binding protein [Candidatus Altiarchaeales archaeon]
MKPLVEFKKVSYKYPDARKNALSNFNLKVNKGEFILVRGPSGSGKTTFLKCINGLVPHYSGGVFQGRVFVNGLDTIKNSIEGISQSVGFIFQDPENQIICSTVEGEIAFGLENKKTPRGQIGRKMAKIAKELEMQPLLKRQISELSSGEKQKVILASVLALEPEILLLDEPSSQLHPESAEKLNAILSKLNKEKNITVILVDHNFNPAGKLKKVDRVINLGQQDKACIHAKPKKVKKTGKVVVRIYNLHYSYAGKKALDGINLKIREGEFVSIIGPNGSGKTTLLKHFNGLLKPSRGDVFIHGVNTRTAIVEELAKTVGFLSQNPNDYLFCDTVEDEVKFTLKNLGLGGDVDGMLVSLSLKEHKHCYPRDLSGGERQRVALASVLIANPKIIVLDEPTRGIDFKSKKKMVEILQSMKSEGKTIVIATHDMDLASHSDRIILMENGRITKND